MDETLTLFFPSFTVIQLHVGKFTYIVSKEHLAGITDKIGNMSV